MHKLLARSLSPLLQVSAVMLLAWLVARSSFDLNAIREASRQGALEALQAVNRANGANVPITGSGSTPISVTIRTANLRGRVGAPVSIVEFADFQCPYCQKFFLETEAPLIERYINNGQISIAYKHLAILGDESLWAAEASECAADQNKFWDYHDLLFERQSGENQGAFTKEKLIGFAQDLKLEMNVFTACLTNDATLAQVQADTREGEAAQVNGTPTFFINGQRLVGAQPLAAFETLIQQFSVEAK